jgi:hypothetical protein
MTVAPLLQREYESNTNLRCPADTASAFCLDSLTIPRSEKSEWEMDFSCRDSEDWLFTVHMRGWQPTGHISVMH